MDDKVLKHKLDALKNSRKLFDNLAKKQSSKSASKPKAENIKSSNLYLNQAHILF